MKKVNILENLGLNEHQSMIYEKLLEKERCSASELVRETGLHRPQVYDALKGLEEMKLVVQAKYKKRKNYVAVSPQKLETLFGQFEKDFYEKIEDYHNAYEKSRANRPIVSFSEGGEAIKETYLDVVNSLGKEEMYLRYMPITAFNREKYIPKGYREVRDKKGLERLIITSESARKENSFALGREIKVVPKKFDLFEYNVSVLIFGDKVSIVDYDTESVINIKHAKFAEFQRKIFKLLFSKL